MIRTKSLTATCIVSLSFQFINMLTVKLKKDGKQYLE